MAGYGEAPFGLNQVKIKAGSTLVTLPAARVLKFKERLVSGELQGNDMTVAAAAVVDAVEWELEAGGISLEAYALLTGRSVVEAGTSPAETTTLTGVGGAAMPYVIIYGKSLGDDGGDVHVKILRAKITDGIEGSFQGGEFFVTACKGIAVADPSTNTIFEVVQNETAAALPSS